MFFIYILLIIILQSLTSIIEHHNGSFKQTLRDLYPAAGIDTNRFASLPGIRTSPVISPFLSYGFFNSYYILFLCTCILCLPLFFFVFFFFRFIILTFVSLYSGGYWAQAENRKQFFTSFAEDHGFDYQLATNWYSITHDQLSSRKVTLLIHLSPIYT